MATTTSRRGQREAKPRQGDRRERAILDATRTLLADKPLSELTVEQIATAAGVSRSSFYFYFADKAQILQVLYSEVLAEMSAELERWFADPERHSEPWSRASIKAAVTIARRNANVVRSALDNRGHDPEIDEVLSLYFDRAVGRSALLIERERAAGLAPPGGPPAPAIARALMHMTLHSIHELLRTDASAKDVEALVDTLTVLWARGVGTDPA
ncbi:MAG: TetR/AcrR family transcriptional regulator [Solirubrobacterales bacterium]